MSISLNVATDRPHRAAADGLVIPVAAGREVLAKLPAAVVRQLVTESKKRDFTGAWASTALIDDVKGVAAGLVALVGVGKNEPLARQAEALRRGVSSVAQELRPQAAKQLVVTVPEVEQASQLAAAAAEGAWIGTYRFSAYSKKLGEQQRKQALRKVTLLVGKEAASETRSALRSASQALAGAELARDLVNRPANDMSPAHLLAVAKDIAKQSDRISLKTFNRAQAQQAGFSAYLAVAQGSETEPYVMHLTYEPEGRTAETKKVFLVGKGITFDSGGINLKPTGYIETMKADMGGAATVLGVFSVLAKVKPDVEVHGLIGACENMVSGKAYRPGDVIRAKNGKTIEIGNTDAEGRVTLADMLSYAAEHQPNAVIDLATLTGAAVVGLGENVAALFGNNDELKEQLEVASTATSEQLAALPMPPEYRPLIDSPIADVNNSGSVRWGGAITAALFLQEFAGDVPWVHLDIAGPAYHEAHYPPYNQKGATGFGVRLLLEYLKTT